MNAIYRLEGSRAIPSDLAAGPWGPSQHGSAPTLLIAHVAETVSSPQPMRVARLTVDLLRPVPLAPLEFRTGIVREGRKIRVLRIELFHGDLLVVTGTVLQIRREVVSLPPPGEVADFAVPSPEQSVRGEQGLVKTNFLGVLEMRIAKGKGFAAEGPSAIWFRLNGNAIEGVPNSPVVTAAMFSDFGNGIAQVLDFRHYTYINADVTMSLVRDPIGDWILVDAETSLGPDGGGTAVARLADRQGYFGQAIQNLLIERR